MARLREFLKPVLDELSGKKEQQEMKIKLNKKKKEKKKKRKPKKDPGSPASAHPRRWLLFQPPPFTSAFSAQDNAAGRVI